MPDSEMFKLVIQGGSFAVLIMILIWAMFKLEPRIREMMEKKDEVIQTIAKTFGETQQKTITELKIMIESLTKTAEETHARKDSECRGERKEMMDTITGEMKLNRELLSKEMEVNREARHNDTKNITKALADMWMSSHQPTPPKNPNKE
jgi:hypothetical protein